MQGETDMELLARLFITTLNAVMDPVLIFNPHWVVTVINQAAQRAFPTAQLGVALDDVFGADLATGLRAEAPLAEWQNGLASLYVPSLAIDRDTNGMVNRYIVVLRDMSAVKRLSLSQNEFIQIVSHDLRSPLTTIKGYTGMLGLDLALTPKQKEYTGKIMSGIQQLTSQVDNIQDAGRFDIETGFYVMQRAQCDVNDLVRRVMDNCVIPAEKQELMTQVELASDMPIINADINMLERALTNLVDNAIKYTPNGGSIHVSTRRGEGRIELVVRDTGLGISPEDQRKLFQRHSRINREEYRRVKGTGLGLFIVRSVAQRHGGDVWVQSALGQGSSFGFFLPLEGANLIFGGVEKE